MPKRYRQLRVAQGSYVATRVGFKPVTLETQGTEPTTEPPCPMAQSFKWNDDGQQSFICGILGN